MYSTGTKGDLNVCTLNLNGFESYKLPPIIGFMISESIDVMCLQDTRIADHDKAHICRTAVERLGPGAQCFFSNCIPQSDEAFPNPDDLSQADPSAPSHPISRSTPRRPKVGGQLIIVNSLWSRYTMDNLKDPTQLGILAGTYINLPDTRLLIAGVYWSCPAQATVPSTSDALWRRLQSFLARKGHHCLDPLHYIQSILMRIVSTHLSTPGNAVILADDFNSTWHDHSASHAALSTWATAGMWRNGLADAHLDSSAICTFWSNADRPTSWIDHVLHHASSPFQFVGGGLSEGPL